MKVNTCYVEYAKFSTFTVNQVKANATYSISIPKQSKGKVITVEMSKTGFASSSKSIKVK